MVPRVEGKSRRLPRDGGEATGQHMTTETTAILAIAISLFAVAVLMGVHP